MNLYQYVGNNPVNWVDPSGLFLIPAFEAALWLAQWGWRAYGGYKTLEALGDFFRKNQSGKTNPLDDYPKNPNDWKPPKGWREETKARDNTGGRHRHWNGPNGEFRRWDQEGGKYQPNLGPHWKDSTRPGEHICPTR